MYVLGIILARAGSKGLPDKCVRPLLGRAVIEYTFDHALAARAVDAVVLTTDSEPAKALARARGITVVDRPAELAIDTATVDDAARHTVRTFEAESGRTVGAVVLLYGNIPVRADGIIDRVVGHLSETDADSVRTVAPATKQHPDWLHRLDGDRMSQYRPNSIYRRQDLEPLYYHDGAVAAVTRAALFAAPRWDGDFQGFLGEDRRAVIQQPEDSVDIDGPVDFFQAEAILQAQHAKGAEASSASRVAWPRLRGHVEDAHVHASVAMPPRASHVDVAPAIAIGDAQIGIGHPVYVIAEAGVNHNGSLDRALQMVDAAADAGADAVKFQMFTARTLVTAGAGAAAYQQRNTGASTQQEMLRRLELTREDFAAIRQRCVDRGVEFLATPFALPDLEALISLGARAIKLASTDLNNVPLVRAAAGAGLPLLVSTGAANANEIEAAVGRMDDWCAAGRTVLLHCVSSYPTEWADANLRAIGELHRRFGRHCGFSDHTLSDQTGALAVAAGARVLEKHFTLDRRLDGPDHAMSLEPDALARYIDNARRAEQAMGSGELDAIAAEDEVRRLARRSLVAARDIAGGEILTADCVIAKRPAGGLEPGDLDLVLGKRAIQPIPTDAQLTLEMVE